MTVGGLRLWVSALAYFHDDHDDRSTYNRRNRKVQWKISSTRRMLQARANLFKYDGRTSERFPRFKSSASLVEIWMQELQVAEAESKHLLFTWLYDNF